MACFLPWLASSQDLHRDYGLALVFHKWGSGHSAHMELWGLLSCIQSNKSSLSDAEDSHDSQEEKKKTRNTAVNVVELYRYMAVHG